MSLILVFKLLRDIRWGLVVVGVLLFSFAMLWCKSTQQGLELWRTMIGRGFLMQELVATFLSGESGKIVAKLVGADRITIGQGLDSLTIGYVHPLLLTILSVWAIGRAAGAIAGELDKGTMELLLAQPLARWQVIASHFMIDGFTIPLLCACLWAGTTTGCYVFNLIEMTAQDKKPVDPLLFGPAIVNVAALLFAISGYTMAISSAGRFRTRVLGIAVVFTLLQFFINLLGQTWPAIEFLRPLTVFFYYQPQGLILDFWTTVWAGVINVAVLTGVGVAGYAAALMIFWWRDLPAPL